MGRFFRWLCIFTVLSLLSGCIYLPTDRQEPAADRITVSSKPTETLQFPYTLPDGLIAEQLLRYSGEYWEDGSDRYVENIAALLICNPTDRMLRFGAFVLEQDGKSLYFFAHYVPPQSQCLVLEYEGKTPIADQVTACREMSIRWEHPEFSQERVSWVCQGQSVTVINRDSRVLEQVTVRYKRYDRARGYYLGGIAYAAYCHIMQPSERKTLTPAHYDPVHAQIVAIEIKSRQ